MDMPRLKTIALCFTLTSAMLASQDVSPALATTASAFFIHSQKAFGGPKGITSEDHDALRACTAADWCRNYFGKGVTADRREELLRILNSGGNPANVEPRE
jgi:hypothetical protein